MMKTAESLNSNRFQHDPRGLSFEDFHRTHGMPRGRSKRGERNQTRYASIGAFSSAHRVVARVALGRGELIYTDQGPLVPRRIVEEVAETLELGQPLYSTPTKPIYGAGDRVRKILWDILDLSEPQPAPLTNEEGVSENGL